MAIIAGIDEAGFGPVLGPLVVSGVAFRVPDARAGVCLWELLRGGVCRKVAKSERRLPVLDSKKLYRSGEGFTALERTALVMLAAGGWRPTTFRSLLQQASPRTVADAEHYPWYAGRDFALPAANGESAAGSRTSPGAPNANDETAIALRANSVRRELESNGAAFLGVFSEVLLEGHYNRLARTTRNKAIVLLGLVMSIVDRIMKASPNESVCVYVDRLGGRTRYREPLCTSLPGYELEILEESSERSAYRLTRAARSCSISFTTEGEDHHFPVALASIYSKYLRELSMMSFNRYWCDQQPGLQPTAGYYADAQRWLADADATVRRLGIRKDQLVRER